MSRLSWLTVAVLSAGVTHVQDVAAAKRRATPRAGESRASGETRTRLTDRATGTRALARGRSAARKPGHSYVSRRKNDRTISALMKRVADEVAAGTAPVVQVDLDLTALMPIERTRSALRQVGDLYNIPEFANPETLAELPGYTPEAFQAWVRSSGFGERYPDLRDMYSLQGSGYWNPAHNTTDVVTPGLVEFVAAVRALGGEVVFNSGRSASLRVDSEDILRRAGIANPVLYIGNNGSDADTKRSRQAEIRERYGKTVAVVDDRVANRAAIIDGLADPTVMSIAMSIPGFSVDPVTRSAKEGLATFSVARAE